MLTITPEARNIINHLKKEHQNLVLVVGSGCCEGPVPQLFKEGDYISASEKSIVHEEEGLRIVFHAPITYTEQHQYIIDVEHGVLNDGFSLESKMDCQFKYMFKQEG